MNRVCLPSPASLAPDATGKFAVLASGADAPACGPSAALGALAMSGHMLLTHAYRYGSAASLAPFTYGQILTATLIGALAFDHLPDTWAVLGMAVIMLSGAALAWSQNRK